MTNLAIRVPPGFTITTEAWAEYVASGRKDPEGLWHEVGEHLGRLETLLKLALGDPERPLLVSVRSGARVSMPGMMETVLNLGLNDQTVEGLARRTGKERFAWDCYRRFLTMFGDVVLGIDRKLFVDLLDAAKARSRADTDADLPVPALRGLVSAYKGLYEEAGEPFPQDPRLQLNLAVHAVFDSWFSRKAEDYRRIHGIPNDWGTAVTVQAMVFGNLGDTSGTGVAFTRDPSTGERRFFGEFLVNAQGEDVVAGIRTPQPIATLRERMPAAYRELEMTERTLEQHYRDLLDIEFTVQEGTLYLLQTRSGKRTAAAAIRIAVEMVQEGLIDRDTALLRLDPAQLDRLLHPVFDQIARAGAIREGWLIARGLPAAPGAAVGRVVFTAADAEEWAARGERVILVRPETSPEDVAGMHVAQGILTARGGLTSHAAVVGRGMGKCCVVGASEIVVDEEAREFRRGDRRVRQGDVVSLDGETGEVILGTVATKPSEIVQVLLERTLPPGGSPLFKNFETIMRWSDEVRTLGVWANADTTLDAVRALAFGAEGVGLCRTEHMFFKPEDRIPIVREMILAKDQKTRLDALAKLLPMQREDFVGIFRAMAGRPVTIRLLDPPLHEFLPREPKIQEELAVLRETGRNLALLLDRVRALSSLDSSLDGLLPRAEIDKELTIRRARIAELEGLLDTTRSLQESNPMLGHRGCRLGITYPEIYEMQVRAIMEAATTALAEGTPVHPEIMIPLTGTSGEMHLMRELTVRVAEAVLAETRVPVAYTVGTMIEVPRAALVADQIAREAEFFSFGTNDLTQMTYGYSRDDVGKFLPLYIENELLLRDPFRVLDQEGVGELIRIAIERGRRTRPELKVGICGEHGGEPSSVEFCHRAGMTYVSCSPFGIPIARLAAAQAAVRQRSRLSMSELGGAE
jgi:pyruvate,orthophosphate dikinase